MSTVNSRRSVICSYCGSEKHSHLDCPNAMGTMPEFKSPTAEIDHDVIAQQDFQSWKKQTPWPLAEEYLTAKPPPNKFSAGALVMVSFTSFIVGAVISNSRLMGLVVSVVKAVL